MNPITPTQDTNATAMATAIALAASAGVDLSKPAAERKAHVPFSNARREERRRKRTLVATHNRANHRLSRKARKKARLAALAKPQS